MKITIDITDDELELLDTMHRTIDFYGDGYDDPPRSQAARPSDEIFNEFMEKIKDALP